ncbi:MAG: hypothetical protein KBF60_03290 [Ignavibacteriaceae bacterium]|nr:hypothetical protein [Ignavibacteriaceae bacterium]
METLALFLLILLAGYLGTGLVLRKISSRNFFPSGMEYLILGLLLNPGLYYFLSSNLTFDIVSPINSEILSKMAPVISGVTGLIGLYWGMKFSLVELLKTNREQIRVAIYDSLLTTVIIGSAAFAFFYYFIDTTNNILEILLASYALAVIGSMSSPYLLQKFREKYELTRKLTDSLYSATRFALFFSLIMFGAIFSFYNFNTRPTMQLTPIEFFTISIGIAISIGILFFIFLGRESDTRKIFVGILGITMLGSGIAYYLGLSPLFLCFILGILLGNLSRIKEKVIDTIERMISPLSIVLTIYAGIIWVLPDSTAAWVVILSFPLIKVIAKFVTHKTAFIAAFEKDRVHSGQGIIFLSSDILVFALLINYATVFNNQYTPIIFSAIILNVFTLGFSASFFTKRFLVESSEISGETK